MVRSKVAPPRACADKRRYPDEGEALRFAVGRPGRKSTDAIQRAYPCRICLGWHLSSKPLVEVITGPVGVDRKKSAYPTPKRRSSKRAGKRPTGGRKKGTRATVL